MGSVGRPPSSISSSKHVRLTPPSAIAIASLLLLPLGGGVAACRRAPPDGLALVGATLIDGSGGPELHDAVTQDRPTLLDARWPDDGSSRA